MSLHVSYVDKEMTDHARASQPGSAALAQGTQYSLLLKNQSAQPWTFYVYQKMPQPVANVFSLAWFCSPYQIRVGNQIKFTWELAYNFVWSDTGQLIPGVDFLPPGWRTAAPAGETPLLFIKRWTWPDRADQGDPAGSLVINDAGNVPNNRFSVGIGMSGTGTYVAQAGTNLLHTFTPTPSYWIAAGTNVTIGSVLSIDTITQTREAKFPSAVFNLVGVLQEDNTWDINPA